MTRGSLSHAIAIGLLTVLGLQWGIGCGRYGPPQRIEPAPAAPDAETEAPDETEEDPADEP